MQSPHSDNHLIRHLLIGILISYRRYRKRLQFHGNINQTSIVGIQNLNEELYPNNTRGDFYDSKGKLKNKKNGKRSGQGHLKFDLYDFRYRLIYHHANMLTVKEWLNFRILALKKKAR